MAKERTTAIQGRLPLSLYYALELYAAKREISLSEAIRRAIIQMIGEELPPRPDKMPWE